MTNRDKIIEVLARAIDLATDEALNTHGRFNTVQMAQAGLDALKAAGYVIERGWRPIEEAEKDGEMVLAAWRGSDPCLLAWKKNARIVAAHKEGRDLHLSAEYFGDPFEHDDFDLADPKQAPTHFRPLPTPPEQEG